MCDNPVNGTRFCSTECMNERIAECCANDKSHTKELSKNV